MDDKAPPATDLEAAVDFVLKEFGGDYRAAIRALLDDLDVLARDYSSSVSRGFIRQETAVWLKTISATALK